MVVIKDVIQERNTLMESSFVIEFNNQQETQKTFLTILQVCFYAIKEKIETVV